MNLLAEYVEYECQSWNDVFRQLKIDVENRELAALKVLIALLITFSPI